MEHDDLHLRWLAGIFLIRKSLVLIPLIPSVSFPLRIADAINSPGNGENINYSPLGIFYELKLVLYLIFCCLLICVLWQLFHSFTQLSFSFHYFTVVLGSVYS